MTPQTQRTSRSDWKSYCLGQRKDLRLTFIVIVVANASGFATVVPLAPTIETPVEPAVEEVVSVVFPVADPIPNNAADKNKDFMMCRSYKGYPTSSQIAGTVNPFIAEFPAHH